MTKHQTPNPSPTNPNISWHFVKTMKFHVCLYACTSFCLFYVSLLTVLCSGSNSENELEQETKTRTRAKTPLEIRFGIQGPKLEHSDQKIHLDYILGDWITADLLRHRFYDFDCEQELEQSPLQPERLETLNEEEDYSEEGFKTWRLSLKLADINASKRIIYLCVRWMLHNLPTSHDDSVEVNFLQTQLTIQIARDGNVSGAKLSAPEPVGIKVNVGGRGRVKVHHDDTGVATGDEL
jgi:hypothetical protein